MSSRSGLSIAFSAALMCSAGLGHAAEPITQIAAASHADMASVPVGRPDVAKDGVSKLSEAANLGVFDAQMKLAAMYASGKGIEGDPARAFDLYRRIINENDEIDPRHERAKHIAHAYVTLGNYYRSGIPNLVDADKVRAVALLHYAASFYGSADAQCDLAQIYLQGEGVTRNERLAVSWLANAAKKRHGRAQALLGDLLWHGSDAVARQPAKGLALLALAKQNAKGEAESRWIAVAYDGAYAGSEPEVREKADELSAQWQARMGRAGVVLSAQSTPVGGSDTPTAAEARKKAQDGITQVGLGSQ